MRFDLVVAPISRRSVPRQFAFQIHGYDAGSNERPAELLRRRCGRSDSKPTPADNRPRYSKRNAASGIGGGVQPW
jgi:hypothetical protein